MAEFTLTLMGHADPDAVREAFNGAVQTVREALDEGFSIAGELVVDGVPYAVDDVPEPEDAQDTEEEDHAQAATDEEVAPATEEIES